jgi:hypothetical protein
MRLPFITLSKLSDLRDYRAHHQATQKGVFTLKGLGMSPWLRLHTYQLSDVLDK